MPYLNRVERLQILLKDLSCDALIIEDTTNLFYLTGQQISSGKLLVHAKGAHLIIDSRYFEMCEKASPFPIILLKDAKTLAHLLASSDLMFIHSLGFNSETVTYGSYLKLQNLVEDLNQATENGRVLTLQPIGDLVQKLRAIKDTEEIDTLKKAAVLGSKGFDFVCSLLKEGISEKEVALELEIFWKRQGSRGLSFDPIIAFGKNSSMPHYKVGEEKLKKGDPVLIDIGVNCEHYHSDMTRVVFFGTPDPRLSSIYNIVKQAQEKGLSLCRPGMLIGALDDAVRSFIASSGHGDHFTHSLGHGIGLDVHEFPTIANKSPYHDIPLEKNMVITIEPGIYLPGIGGVRIEDTIVITDGVCENLTNRTKELTIL